MYIFFIIIAVLLGVGVVFLKHPLFGKAASGERLQRIKQSKNFRDGEFQNLSHTPAMTEGVSYFGVIKELLFAKVEEAYPIDSIPHVQTDLAEFPTDMDGLVWFGHSSYYMQIEGVKFLVDPVFTKNASPLYGTNNAFKGADLTLSDDMPHLDYLIITHDHYDHLDYTTFQQLKDKVSHVICPLGVGEHLEFWGYPSEQITELDWYETIKLKNNMSLTSTPARHFSGRSFKRNQTLWTSYVLKATNLKIFVGGDSGYDTHFKMIGEKYGPFDLAILENGQYDYKWKYIHMMPEEVLLATQDLSAKRVLPVHSGKFKLANHPWKEPLEKVTSLNDDGPRLSVITPMIGELVDFRNENQLFQRWWK
ncbi:MBL fold metallo-hydrolase [Sphingobacterium olei]|uniref:MBL fold metallo-hydrolase n=1 Tax=Sphingobacterium olei TaxID=2571155 RepID=A0A4U0NC26_9SPHI|nr:MBL fold metallo-hydrolase [Sphingobacterium olei]TJZ51521.1 MBL fold metallo-hydrolase [Sphingobacterium olei]